MTIRKHLVAIAIQTSMVISNGIGIHNCISAEININQTAWMGLEDHKEIYLSVNSV